VAAQLIILCHLERLRVLDGGSQLGFGMNLSVAWDRDNPPAAGWNPALLKPWQWPRVRRLKVCWRRSGANETPIDIVITEPASSAVEALLAKTLDAQFDGAAGNLANLSWPMSSGTAPASVRVDNDRRPWNAFVMNLATGPALLSRQLNLALTFRCEAPDNRDSLELVAAPIIDDDPLFAGGREPNDTPAVDERLQSPLVWQYATGSPAIVACTAPCSIEPRKGPGINLATQWVSIPGDGKAVSYEDWEAALPRRAADGFRQDRFLRDYLRSHTAAMPRGDQRWVLIDRLLAAVRDAAGPGIAEGTQGVRPAAVLLERRGIGERIQLSGEQWRCLEEASEDLFPTLAEWIVFLRASVAETAGLKMLAIAPGAAGAAAGRPELEDTQVAAEAGRMLDIIDDGRTNAQQASALWRLFIAQWELLVKKAPGFDKDTGAPILAKLRALSVNPDSGAELSALLADALLGRYWKAFIGSNKADRSKDSLGTGLVDACYPWFALFHARTRWGVPDPGGKSAALNIAQDSVALPRQPLVFAPAAPGQLTAETLTRLEAFFCDWIKKSRDTLRPTAPALATVPGPLTFQVAALESDASEQDQQDILRQFAGFGVLMRENVQPPAEWRCLNMALLHRGEQDRLVRDPLLVPYRLHYQGDLRRVCVSYNNQSLVADSPLAERQMAGVQLEDKGKLDSGATLRYRYAPGARIPGLKFGSSYDIAVFAISNTGTLPKEIADRNRPYALRPITAADERTLIASGVIRQKIPYRRTVPVGEMRLCHTRPRPDGADDPIQLPTIPDGVTPLALDLLDKLMPETTNADGGAPRPPLILLSPPSWTGPESRARSSAEFAVRLPQVTWSCYDRWIAGTSRATPADRKKLIAEVHRRHAADLAASASAVKGTVARKPPNTSVDDPAVVRLVHLSLSVEKSERFETVKEEFVKVGGPETPAADPLSAFTSGRAFVKCELFSTDSDEPDLTDPAGEIVVESTPPVSGVAQPDRAIVRIRKGRVYKLTLSACVTGGAAARRFDDVILQLPKQKAPRPVTRPGSPPQPLLLMSPTDMLIEGATSALPTEEELYKASIPQFEITSVPNTTSTRPLAPVHKIRVALTPIVSGQLIGSFRWVHQAEVDRQAWSWSGRPAETHPHLRPGAVTPAALSEAVRDWVAQEFGERPDNAFVTSAMTAKPCDHPSTPGRQLPGFRTFIYEDLLASDTARHDLRGQHRRYSVRVHSRYAPLIRDELSRSRQAKIVVGTRGQERASVSTRWHEVFVPSRRRPPIDPPRVKLILPLTEGAGQSAAGTPGLLVVLNEPWYEVAGIGEALRVEVGEAESPWDAEKGLSYLEFGPDPIVQPHGHPPHEQPMLTGEHFAKIGDSDDIVSDGSRAFVTGPVGHYFDRDNNAALFVGTSFIVPPPHVKRTDETRAWYFARLRFRRKVVTREPRTGSGIYSITDSAWPRSTYFSEPTTDFWVQYLPEFSVFDGWKDTIDKLVPALTAPGSMQLLEGEGGPAAELGPTASANNIFSLYAVLTRVVFDARGLPGETYVTVFAQSPDRKNWTTNTNITAFAAMPREQFRVRLIEVQAPDSAASPGCATPRPTGTDLWGWLFPDKGKTAEVGKKTHACDTPGRIVRVSRPLPAINQGTQ
jgi:hypothetical protein